MNSAVIFGTVIVISAFIIFATFLIGAAWAKRHGIKTTRIRRGDELFYVLPWPDADEESWAQHMRSLEKDNGMHGIPACYWKRWQDYVGQHLPLSTTMK